MADGLNRATLLGNLGDDPDLRTAQNGKSLLKFSVATSQSWIDRESGERKERTEWHRVVIWGKRGEGLAKILIKGSRVYIEGEIRTQRYEDKEGVTKYSTEIVAQNILLAGGARRSSQNQNQPRNDDAYDDGAAYGRADDGDDIPF